jgi:hypothetical protein
LAAYALTLLIGLSLGVLGAGGAILMVPVLIYVAGLAPSAAIPVSMAVMSVTSAAGATGYLKRGDVSPRLAVVFGLGGALGAFAGSSFTHLLPERWLLLIFAAMLVVVGVTMLTRRDSLTCSNPCLPPRCFLIAAGIGLITGFLGVGGGFLLVPALMRFAGLGPRAATGTSLALIAINAAVGLAGQLRYVSLDWRLAAGYLAFALAGMLLGVRIAPRLPERRLQHALAALLAAIGAAIGAANLA